MSLVFLRIVKLHDFKKIKKITQTDKPSQNKILCSVMMVKHCRIFIFVVLLPNYQFGLTGQEKQMRVKAANRCYMDEK